MTPLLFLQAIQQPLAAPPPIVTPNNLIGSFISAAATWEPVIRAATLYVMGTLMVIDFVWSSIRMAADGEDYHAVVKFLSLRSIIWGVYWGFLQLNWAHVIIDGFVALGKKAGHLPAGTTASSLFAAGANITGSLFKAATTTGLILGPITSLPFMIAGGLIIAAFVWLALHYVKFMVEAYTSIVAGMFFLGFGALPVTRQYAERYITLVLSAGIRLQLFFLMLSVANSLVAYWQKNASQIPFTTDAIVSGFVMAGECILYAVLCWGLPTWVASLIQGTVQFSGQHLTGFITPYAQGATVIAGMGATAAISGVGAAVSAMPGTVGSVARAIGGGSGGGGNGKSPNQPSPGLGAVVGSNGSSGRVPKQPTP